MANKFSLVFGGCGALGKAVIQRLSFEGYKAVSIDLMNNADAHRNILIRPSWTLHEQSVVIREGIHDILGKHKASNVFCAAGGWKGGAVRDSDFLQIFADNHKVNLEPALLACHFGIANLAHNGLLVVTGAAAALGPTPNMLAYGLAKSATHYMIQSIAHDESVKNDGISAIAVLPQVIDTLTNRFSMPNADYTTWTKVFFFFLNRHANI
jgi:dihydropteridine reductase